MNMRRTAIIMTLLGLSFAGTGLWSALAAPRGTVVVFNANWCASCREVLPIVREVAGQNSMSIVEIDIDSQQAPKQARTLGLSMPNDEPPQVFYVDRGRSTLLYSGKQFKYGSGDAVRATVLQNLQRVRP